MVSAVGTTSGFVASPVYKPPQPTGSITPKHTPPIEAHKATLQIRGSVLDKKV